MIGIGINIWTGLYGGGAVIIPGTLSAGRGTFTLTGLDAGLTGTRTLPAAVGNFALTGIAATLTYTPFVGAYTLTAGTGAFVLNGEAMTPLVSYSLPAAVGAFALTGNDAVLSATTRTLSAAVGSFTLTGVAATLTKSGSASATFTPTFANGQSIGFASTTYTSPTVTLGTGTILIFVGANAGRIGTISSVTIGGVTATNIAGATNSNQGAWYANGVTSPTGTVVIVNSAAWGEVVVNGGLIVSVSSTPSASSVFANSGADPQAFTSISVPSSGIGVAGISVGWGGAGAGLPLSWSGATRAAAMEAASSAFDIGGASTASAGTFNPTVTSTANAWNFNGAAGSLISWAP